MTQTTQNEQLKELRAEWFETYLAFVGAFDHPMARLTMQNEYTTDARKRMWDFNIKMENLLDEN